MRPLAILLFLGLTRTTLAEGVRVDSLSFQVDEARASGAADLPRYGPIAFWSEGRADLVYVRTSIAELPAGRVRLLATVRWLLRPEGAPASGASDLWSDPETRSDSSLDLQHPCRDAELLFTIPFARRVREWREAGLTPLRCEVTLHVGEAVIARDLPVVR